MNKEEKFDIEAALVAEYEDVIQSLKMQLEVSKEDFRNLKEQVLELISENEKLSTKLDLEYKQKLNEARDGNFIDAFNSELVVNLQKQLDTCKKEKKKTLELYETSLSLIEKYENETFQQKFNASNNSKEPAAYSGFNKAILEAKLKNAKEELEMVMNGRDQLENENIMLKTEVAKLKLNLDSNNKLLDDLKVKEVEWKNKCVKTQQDYALLSATYECVVQSRNELESKLDLYGKNVQELIERDCESKNKVAEALDVAEKAIVEKDSALLREHQLKEEVSKLQLSIEHVIEEAGKKVAREIEQTEGKYELVLNNALKELADLKSTSDKMKKENKKLASKYKKLEKISSAKLNKEKISLIKGSETEITILENQLDLVHQELEKVKSKNEELIAEKLSLEKEIRNVLEENQCLRLEKEEKDNFAEESLHRLKSEMETKVDELNESTKRCEFFINQIRELEEENKNFRNKTRKCNCDKLKAKLVKLNEVRIVQTAELESHIESLMKLNEAWKTEMKEVTSKFEDKIQELRTECKKLKSKNKKITLELEEARKTKLSLPT